MSREFKFRAWDKRECLQQMMYLNGFIMYGEGWTGGNPAYKFIELNFANGGFGKWSFNDIVLMQFSGLRDKNGKERYECDIIRRHTGYVFEEKIYEFGLGPHGQAVAHGYSFMPDDEIIGNKFEHPNLLQP